MNFNFDQNNILNEGGNAIKSSRPIRGDLALPVANQVIDILKKQYPNIEFSPIGSTGKKGKEQTSGDVDIAVQMEFAESDNIIDFLKGKYPDMEINVLKGFHIISIGFPYNNQIVQVDLMFFPNIELAKYFYYSPDFTKNQSKFKGSVRNLLMISILKNIPVQEKQNTTFENGHFKDIYKYTLKPEQGLVILHQSFEGKKGQEIKTKHTIKEDTEFVTSDTNQITKFMMGESADDETISSFEKMVEWMKTDKFPYRDYNEQIFDDLYDYIEHQIPENLTDTKSYVQSEMNTNERRKFKKLGDIISESFTRRINSPNVLNGIKDKEEKPFKPSVEELVKECNEILKDFFLEEYIDSEECTDNKTFFEIGLNEYDEENVNLCFSEYNSFFGISFRMLNSALDENYEYYSFSFVDKGMVGERFSALTYNQSETIKNIVKTIVESLCEDPNLPYDSRDLSSMSECLEQLNVVKYLTQKSKEDYKWAKEQVSDFKDEDEFELNESFTKKISNRSVSDLEKSSDDIFDLEEILTKITKCCYNDNDDLYKYIWLPVPSDNEITDDDTFKFKTRDKFIYPQALLVSEYDEGGFGEDGKLLVRFGEDDPYGEISAENDEYFSDLEKPYQFKIKKLVEIALGKPFDELYRYSMNLEESFTRKTAKTNTNNILDKSKIEIVPEVFVNHIVENCFKPLSWEKSEVDSDGNVDSYNDYDLDLENEQYKLIDFGIEGHDWSEGEFEFEIVFCKGEYPTFTDFKNTTNEWGVSMRFSIGNFGAGEIDFVLGEPFFRGRNYKDFYRLNAQTLNTIINILNIIGLRHDKNETFGLGGSYKTLMYSGYGDEYTYKGLVYSDTFNLSKLFKYMDKESQELYNSTINEITEEEMEMDDEDYYDF